MKNIQTDSQPIVSVLIPLKGEPRYLKQSLYSIFLQGYPLIDIVIVVSGEDKLVRDICTSFSTYWTSLKVIQLSENVSLPEALNVGISHCKGEFIARLDEDDLMLGRRIESQLKIMKRNHDVVAVGGQRIIIDKKSEYVSSPQQYPKSNFLIRWYLHQFCPFAHPGVMIRTSALREVGGYDESFDVAEDYELWLRLSRVGQLRNTSETVLAFRIHDTNKSAKEIGRVDSWMKIAREQNCFGIHLRPPNRLFPDFIFEIIFFLRNHINFRLNRLTRSFWDKKNLSYFNKRYNLFLQN